MSWGSASESDISGKLWSRKLRWDIIFGHAESFLNLVETVKAGGYRRDLERIKNKKN